MTILFVTIGGALGAILRLFTVKATHIFASKYSLTPYLAIPITNLIGCIIFAIIFVVSIKNTAISEQMKLCIFTGFLGSYTTFSTFMFETYDLLEKQGFLQSFSYFFLSTSISFAAIYLIIKFFS